MKITLIVTFILACNTMVYANYTGRSASHNEHWLTTLFNEIKEDTKEVLGKEFKTTYFRDFLEKDGDSRNKIGVSTPLLAWKFVTVEPSFIYTPKSDHEVVEFGLSFPIRIDRVPLGKDNIFANFVEKYKQKDKVSKWLKKVYFGPYLSHNVSTGKFGFGVNTGFRFGK